MLRKEAGEKVVLTGFAIAYEFVYRMSTPGGQVTRERGTVSFGPHLIQADCLPPKLAESIKSFLLERFQK